MFRRILTGSALSIITLLTNILVAMWMMPFIIHALGDTNYGLWVVVASVVGYYGLLDFGMSSAVTRFISRAEGRGDSEEVNVILNTASFFFAILGLLVFVISSIAAMLVDDQVIAILLLTVGITCIFQFGLRGFYGVFFARIRQDIMSYTTLSKIAIRTALIYYFLSNGYGVVALAIITMATEILTYAIDMFILRRIAPDLILDKVLIQKDRMRDMLKYGAFSMVTQVSDLLRLRALPFIVTYAVGLANVVFFAIAIRLMEIYFQIVEKAVHILTPVFSQYESRGENEKVKRVFWITFRINLILSFMIGMTLIIFANPFIAWWIGNEYTLASELTVIMAVGFMAYTLNQAGKTVLFGISKHQRFAVISMTESILGSSVALVLGLTGGVISIAHGLVLTMLIFELLVKPLIVAEEIGVSVLKYYAVILEVAGKVMLPMGAIAFWMHSRGETMGILEMFLFGSLIWAVMVPFMWWSLNARGKELLHRKIISRLHRRVVNA